MRKRDCAILGLHILLVTGITSGYVCTYKKMIKKNPKLKSDNLEF